MHKEKTDEVTTQIVPQKYPGWARDMPWQPVCEKSQKMHHTHLALF